MTSRSGRLARVNLAFKKLLFLPDPGMVEITLAAAAANLLPGEPVWLFLVGAPSCGKTEVLNSLLGLPRVFPVSTLTEAALLSGTKAKERADDATGGLLAEIGEEPAIVVVKDFTSILSMNRERLRTLLAAFREIYDGAWIRRLGIDGGRSLSWRGRVALIGGVTSAIDSHHAVMSEMGPRFAFYRISPIDPRKQADWAIRKTGMEQKMREELTGRVSALFDGLDVENPPRLFDANTEWISDLAALVATCRSAVERHGYIREIELVHGAEAPARLAKMLVQLQRGALIIGVPPERAKQLIVKTGLDCIPPVRRIALDALLLKGPAPLTLAQIAKGTGYPEGTLRRAIEDLECHRVVEHGAKHRLADTWRLAEPWRLQVELLR